MDRLTKEKIEQIRCTGVYDLYEGDVDALCDLALQSISQESVRSETLELLADALKEFKDDIRGAPVWPATRLGLIERIERVLQYPARVAEGERSDHDVVGEHLHSTELRK